MKKALWESIPITKTEKILTEEEINWKRTKNLLTTLLAVAALTALLFMGYMVGV